MRLDELMRFVGRFFGQEKIDYFIVGAAAMDFWIPPRMTVDFDVILCVDPPRALRLFEKLRSRRFPITAPRIRSFMKGRMIKLPLGKSELDLKLGVSNHEREALARSRMFKDKDFRLRIAVPEDLILFKLQ